MSRTTSKGTPFPPAFTARGSRVFQEARDISSTSQNQYEENAKARHLREIVSKIYNRKQLSEVDDDDDEPVCNTSVKSIYQELMNDADGLADFTQESPSFIYPQRYPSRSELALRCQANSYYEIMEQQIRHLEDVRRISVETTFKERLSDVLNYRKKVWDDSVRQLEERLSQVHLMVDPSSFLKTNDPDFERDYKAVNEMYHRKEQESEARIRQIINSAMADAEQKKVMEEKAAQETEEQQQIATLHADFVKSVEELSKCPFLNNPEVSAIMMRNRLDIPTLNTSGNTEGLGLDYLKDNVPKIKSTLIEIQEWQENRRAKENQKLLLKRRVEEEQQKQKVRQEAELREKQILQEQKAAELKKDETPSSSVTGFLDCSVSQANLERYEDVVTFKKEFESSLKAVTQDPSLKAFVFKCQKAIFTPVNSIGRANASHLSDKLEKLKSVLRGNTIMVSDEPFSASTHPLGISLCKSLLAKQLLVQGEKVVQAQLKDAFTISLVVVALWDEFQDVGKLFLANLYEACPFLIPCHFPKTPGTTEEAHYKKMGYLYKENIIEDQVTFENRMSGISRLYAAILITALPKDLIKSGHDHPHGLGNAWRWLASALNLNPINGVTAVIMTNILEVCGFKLVQNYKGLFLSLLAFIERDFVKCLKPVSMDRSIFALTSVLEEALKTKTMKEPEGLLQLGFL